MGGRSSSSNLGGRTSNTSGQNNSGAPGTRMVGDGYSFVVDHQDEYGGIFSYEGSAGGYTIGQTYDAKESNHDDVGGVPAKMTAASIHVYPNGQADMIFNGTSYGIRFNETYRFRVRMPMRE